MPVHTVFFDLDGTLCDSKPGIVRSITYALDALGVRVEEESLDQFIGPPLEHTFGRFGFSGSELERAVAKFRERYAAKGIHELSLYPGVPRLLQTLHEAGLRLILATSKRETSAVEILRHTGIARFFTFMAGADPSQNRLEKSAVIRHACAGAGITAMDGCIMVGDREYDVRGAHAVGMRCAGILYGYGTRRELESTGADVILGSVEDLGQWLLGETA